MQLTGIYMVTNPEGKIYIGLSNDIQTRWARYKYPCNFKTQKLLYRSIKKYGYESHKFEILEECSKDLLFDREIFWINQKQSYFYDNKNIGLNLTKGGESPPKQTGPKSAQHRKKISEANKGRKPSPETIQKIKEARARQVFTNETKQKMANARRGKPSILKGKKRPNISEKLKGKLTPISIKCSLTNTITGDIIQAGSMQELSRKSKVSITSLIKIRRGDFIKKYKYFKYTQIKDDNYNQSTQQ
jgi:group I intron endonuclease